MISIAQVMIGLRRKFPDHCAFVAYSDSGSAAVSATCIPARRVTPPSIYYRKNDNGKLEVEWNADKPSSRPADADPVPLFSASELAPTHHDGATGAVLGCPHYARACKLRHPVSGRLYTCRLCCEQEREMPSKDQDEPLDRYADYSNQHFIYHNVTQVTADLNRISLFLPASEGNLCCQICCPKPNEL